MKHSTLVSTRFWSLTVGMMGVVSLAACGGGEPEPTPTPDPVTPVAQAGAVSVKEGQTVSITLEGAAGEGESVAFSIVNAPANGRLEGTAPALTYVPNAHYLGRDAFTFTVSVGERTSAPATVEIEVLNAPYYTITRGSQEQQSKLYFTNARGEAALVGETGHALIAITVDPTDGALYAVTRQQDFEAACNRCLVKLDVETGAATVVGTLEDATGAHHVPSLAFTSDGTLFGYTVDQEAVQIDKTTGAISMLSSASQPAFAMGLWADAEDTLWILGGSGAVYTLDPISGEVTLIHEEEVLRASADVPAGSDFSLRGDRNPDTGAYWGVSPGWSVTSTSVIRLDISAEAARFIDVADVGAVLVSHNLAFVR